MSLYDKASLILPVSPAYKDGALQSYKPLTSEGTFTFSRGSNLAATRVGADGLIEKGRENKIFYSNIFSNTVWLLQFSTITSGQSGYDGSSNAWLLDSNIAGGNIRQGSSVSGVNTFSVYAKKGTADGIRVRFDQTSDTNVYVDLRDGSVFTSGNTIDIDVQSIGSGWYRVTFAMLNAGLALFRVYPTDGSTSTIVGNILIQDAQVEQGLVATEYIETTTTTGTAGILEDLPRLDYSGGATCPSLLLEGSRTNLIDYSEYFGGWSITRVAVNSNADDSPEGRANATKVVPNTSGGEHFIARSGFNRTAGEYLSHTVYAKADGYDYLYISNGASRLYGIYNLSNGSVEYVNSNGVDFTNHSASVESVGNGWYRCTLIGQALVTGSTYMRLACAPTPVNIHTPSFAGDGTSGALIYGAQVEAGAYPTSLIPTYGTSVTRSFDKIGDSIIPSFNDNNEFTFFFDLYRIGVGSDSIASAYEFRADNYATNFVMWVDSPSAQIRFRDALNGYANMGGVIPFLAGTNKKIAISCDGVTFKTFVNGSLIHSYNVVNQFSINRLYQYAKAINKKQYLNFPTALTDAECIALTTI